MTSFVLARIGWTVGAGTIAAIGAAGASMDAIPAWLQSLDALGVAGVMWVGWSKADKRADTAQAELINVLKESVGNLQAIKDALVRIEGKS